MARRSSYVVEGNTVRHYSYAEPVRRERPAERPQPKKRVVTYPKAAKKAENSLSFDMRYTVVVCITLLCMIASCIIMLYVQGKVEAREKNIESLQSELQVVQADNSAYENSLNNMYAMEDIYKIATSELGMVYSQTGQIVYYDQANGDYVKQYEDVPGSGK